MRPASLLLASLLAASGAFAKGKSSAELKKERSRRPVLVNLAAECMWKTANRAADEPALIPEFDRQLKSFREEIRAKPPTESAELAWVLHMTENADKLYALLSPSDYDEFADCYWEYPGAKALNGGLENKGIDRLTFTDVKHSMPQCDTGLDWRPDHRAFVTESGRNVLHAATLRGALQVCRELRARAAERVTQPEDSIRAGGASEDERKAPRPEAALGSMSGKLDAARAALARGDRGEAQAQLAGFFDGLDPRLAGEAAGSKSEKVRQLVGEAARLYARAVPAGAGEMPEFRRLPSTVRSLAADAVRVERARAALDAGRATEADARARAAAPKKGAKPFERIAPKPPPGTAELALGMVASRLPLLSSGYRKTLRRQAYRVECDFRRAERAYSSAELLRVSVSDPRLPEELRGEFEASLDEYRRILAEKDEAVQYAELIAWQQGIDGLLARAPALRDSARRAELVRGERLAAAALAKAFGDGPPVAALRKRPLSPEEIRGLAAALGALAPERRGPAESALKDYELAARARAGADSADALDPESAAARKEYLARLGDIQRFQHQAIAEGLAEDGDQFSAEELGHSRDAGVTGGKIETVAGRQGLWIESEGGRAQFHSFDGTLEAKRLRDPNLGPLSIVTETARPEKATVISLDPKSQWVSQQGRLGPSGFEPVVTFMRDGSATLNLKDALDATASPTMRRINLELLALNAAEAAGDAGSPGRFAALTRWLSDGVDHRTHRPTGLVAKPGGRYELVLEHYDGQSYRVQIAQFGQGIQLQGRERGDSLIVQIAQFQRSGLDFDRIPDDGFDPGARAHEYRADGSAAKLSFRRRESGAKWELHAVPDEGDSVKIAEGKTGKEDDDSIRIPGLGFSVKEFGKALEDAPVLGTVNKGLGWAGEKTLNFVAGGNLYLAGEIIGGEAGRELKLDGGVGLARMLNSKEDALAYVKSLDRKELVLLRNAIKEQRLAQLRESYSRKGLAPGVMDQRTRAITEWDKALDREPANEAERKEKEAVYELLAKAVLDPATPLGPGSQSARYVAFAEESFARREAGWGGLAKGAGLYAAGMAGGLAVESGAGALRALPGVVLFQGVGKLAGTGKVPTSVVQVGARVGLGVLNYADWVDMAVAGDELLYAAIRGDSQGVLSGIASLGQEYASEKASSVPDGGAPQWDLSPDPSAPAVQASVIPGLPAQPSGAAIPRAAEAAARSNADFVRRLVALETRKPDSVTGIVGSADVELQTFSDCVLHSIRNDPSAPENVRLMSPEDFLKFAERLTGFPIREHGMSHGVDAETGKVDPDAHLPKVLDALGLELRKGSHYDGTLSWEDLRRQVDEKARAGGTLMARVGYAGGPGHMLSVVAVFEDENGARKVLVADSLEGQGRSGRRRTTYKEYDFASFSDAPWTTYEIGPKRVADGAGGVRELTPKGVVESANAALRRILDSAERLIPGRGFAGATKGDRVRIERLTLAEGDQRVLHIGEESSGTEVVLTRLPGDELAVSVDGGAQLRILKRGERVTIGRGHAGPDALVASDPTVSRKHLEIGLGPDGQVLWTDLGSSNGTRVRPPGGVAAAGAASPRGPPRDLRVRHPRPGKTVPLSALNPPWNDPRTIETARAKGHLFRLEPGKLDALDAKDPGTRHNYCVVENPDGSLAFEIGRVTYDNKKEIGVKHAQVADGRPVLFSGEVYRDPRTGRLEFDFNSGTFSDRGLNPLWIPNASNAAALKAYAKAILGVDAVVVDHARGRVPIETGLTGGPVSPPRASSAGGEALRGSPDRDAHLKVLKSRLPKPDADKLGRLKSEIERLGKDETARARLKSRLMAEIKARPGNGSLGGKPLSDLAESELSKRVGELPGIKAELAAEAAIKERELLELAMSRAPPGVDASSPEAFERSMRARATEAELADFPLGSARWSARVKSIGDRVDSTLEGVGFDGTGPGRVLGVAVFGEDASLVVVSFNGEAKALARKFKEARGFEKALEGLDPEKPGDLRKISDFVAAELRRRLGDEYMVADLDADADIFPLLQPLKPGDTGVKDQKDAERYSTNNRWCAEKKLFRGVRDRPESLPRLVEWGVRWRDDPDKNDYKLSYFPDYMRPCPHCIKNRELMLGGGAAMGGRPGLSVSP